MTLPDRNDVYRHRMFHWSGHNSPSREAQDEERETPVRKQHHLVASINTHTPCLPCYFTSNPALLVQYQGRGETLICMTFRSHS